MIPLYKLPSQNNKDRKQKEAARGSGEQGIYSQCFMITESQFYKMKKVLEIGCVIM